MKKILLFFATLIFTLQISAQTVTVSAPNGGEVWNACNAQTVTWTSSATSNYFNVDYSIDNGVSWQAVATNYFQAGPSCSFTWTIPNISSTQALVRVYDYNNHAIRDSSNNVFTIISSVAITAANGGETWQGGTLHNITWTQGTGNSNYWNLQYSTDAGSTWTNIVTNYYNTASTGSYAWTVPNAPSTTCLVRIYDYNQAPGSCRSDASNNLFTITPATQVITVTNPNGGNTYYVGGSYAITWTSQYVTAGQYVELDYSTNNGTSWNVISASTALSAGTYTWNPIPNTPSTNCLVRIRSTADTTIGDISNAVFSIVYPYVTVTSPNGAETWNGCSSQTISWTYSGYISQLWKVDYSTNNGATWNNLVSSTAATSYVWQVPNGVTYNQSMVRVTSTTDTLIRDLSNANFTINNYTYIVVTSPNGGENWQVNNPVTRNITWSFSGTSNYFNIYYSVNGGSTWNTIVSSQYATGGAGTYAWTIPNLPSTNCMVMVQDYNNSCMSDTTNARFTISAPTPVITVTNPNGGNVYYVGGSYAITWTSQYVTAGNFVELDYSTNNGASWNVISAATALSAGTYTWNPIPNTPSTNCLVRVRSTADTTIKDVSNAVFSIAYPFVTVNSPNGGESWNGCSSQTISWSYAGYTSQNWKVEYSTNNGGSWNTIVSATSATSYTWQVPNGVTYNQSLVRVTSTTDTLIRDASNANFTINNYTYIIVTSPNGGENWQVNNPVSRNITWSFSGTSNYFNIYYSTNGGSTWNTIVSSQYATGGTGTYAWTIPNLPSTNCMVMVQDYNNSCMSDTSNAHFTIVAPTPVITITNPNGGNTYYVGGSYAITWTSQYVTAGPYVEIDYSTNNGTSWNVITTSGVLSTGTYTWNPIPNTPSNQCLVRVRSTADTTISDVSNAVFNIVYPYVTVNSPNGGESWNGCSSQTISWTYSGYTSQNWKVEYSTNNGSNWNTIISATSATSYTWQVPNGVTYNQCLVRVTSTNDTLIRDASNANFTINNYTYIIVTSPNGGENWQISNPATRNITWSFSGTSNYFNLYYSTNGGSTWNSIVNSQYATGGTGTYVWTVPNQPSTNCMVMVQDYNNSCMSDTSNAHFTISAPTSVITVTNPNGGNTYYVGGSYAITWTSQYVTGNFAEIDYSTNNGASWNVLTSSAVLSTGTYTWNPIPNTPSNQCLVRVRSTADTTINDVSNAVFNIVYPYVTVNSPNGGESWNGCSSQTISWTYSGYTSQNWKVEYSTNNGGSWNTIVSATSATSYTWQVPNGVTYNQSLVRVTSTTDTLIRDASNANFTINNYTYIIVTSPNGGENWQVNNPATRNITWSFSGTSNYFNIYYSTNGGSTWNTVVNSQYATGGTGTYAWTIPNLPSTNCMVMVQDYNNSCMSDTSNAHFTIVAPTPVITVTNPNGGNVYYVGGSYAITWTSQYVTAGPYVEIDYSTNNGNSWNVVTTSGVLSNGTYTWNPIPNTPSTSCLVRVRSTADTTISDVSNAVFSIAYPFVTVNSPNGGESWNGCSSQTISWSYAGYTIQNWKVEYSTNNGTNWNTIVSSTSATSYAWQVPNGVTYNQCLVRVTSTTDTLIRDASNANFTINNYTYIIVTSPNGGENWQVNNPATRNITWSFSGTSNYFNIYYSTNGGSTWNTIVSSQYATGGNGNYAWTVPNLPSANCMVMIQDYNNSCMSDTSNAHFTISAPTPYITVTNPNGGNTLYGYNTASVTWTSQYLTSTFVRIEYSIDSGANWQLITAAASNTGSYSWTVPNISSTKCLVRVTDYGNNATFDVSNAVFTIAPAVTVTAPNGGENVVGCTVTSIAWTGEPGSNNYLLQYSLNGGNTWITIVSQAFTGGPYYTYNWTLPNTPSGYCLVKVTNTGNTNKVDQSNAVFNITPTIVVTNPNNGGNFTAGSNLNITWTSQGVSNYYNIDYSLNGGSTWTNIIYNTYITSNTYLWTLPVTLSSNALVRVTDYANTCKQAQSGTAFTIATSPPAITVTAPNGGENWVACGTYNITWSANATSGVFVIQYSSNNGNTWTTLSNGYHSNNGVYAWTVPSTPTSLGLVRVMDSVNNTLVDVSNANFTISSLAAPGAITGTTTVCQGSSQTYTTTLVTGATSYTWTLPSGWSGSSNTNTITALVGTGSGNISVVANSGCGSSSASTLAVTTSLLPSTPGSISGTVTPCVGSAYNYSILPVSGASSYFWILPSGWTGSSVGDSISVTIGSNIGQVQVTANNACGASATSTLNIVATGAPAAPSVVVGPASGCISTNLLYSVAPVSGATSYTWSLPLGWTGLSTTDSITVAASGTGGTISVTANNSCGFSTPATLSVATTSAVTPSVSITSSGAIICNGQNVTFTAAPVNGGLTPSYQWYKNGAIMGSSSSTYSSTTLANNDSVWVVMTTALTCVNASTATSGKITIAVNGTVTPAVSITPSPGLSICSGTQAIFTTTPVNGGVTPSYQWKKNGANIGGATGSSYSSSALASGDIISVVMTSSLSCASPTTATSNADTMTVSANVTASVSISSSPASPICSGTNVSFTVTPVNGGTTPAYQWQLNNVNIPGATASTYATTGLNSGDAVKVLMTSNANCVTPSTVTSNSISYSVNPNVVPTVTVTALATVVCNSGTTTFTAAPFNGGSSPVYQWYKNGLTAGTNSASYTPGGLNNNDSVWVVLTSNAACVQPSSATSNKVVMSVVSNVIPTDTISVSPGNVVCSGSNVVFSSTIANGGSSPSYQWKKNGTPINGAITSSYSSTSLANGDVITLQLTSNAACASPATANSNAITLSVVNNVTPALSIGTGLTSVCSGVPVTFTATPTNGGSTPFYQWKVNGSTVYTGSGTFTTSTLNNGDIVGCVITSSLACVTQPTATSNNITMAVGTAVTPTISISGTATICSSAHDNFTASITNGGLSPVYQWYRNGVAAGGNSNSYNDSVWNVGDRLWCVLTSNAACASVTSVNSDTIALNVSPSVTPTIQILANPNGAVCAGTGVTLSAVITNGGNNPTYNWKKNGSAVGSDSVNYSSSGFVNGDVIYCQLISNASCPTVNALNSNNIIINITAPLTPSVVISANTGTSICTGQNVIFTAVPANGGNTPAYVWKKNGNVVGTNSTTYSTSSLVNGDVITCVLTSSLTSCLTQSTATSNQLAMTVSGSIVPTINITTASTHICGGTLVTFTANATGGGASPTYQWTRNGINAGTNSTYASAALVNGDIISCLLTSSSGCASPATALSNTDTMTVTNSVATAVSISASATTICSGGPVTFTAAPTSGGASPIYNWKVNGVSTGITANTYTTSSLNAGDAVTCDMTSSFACAIPAVASSNSISVTVNPTAAPAITISTGSTNLCHGTAATFTSAITYGGSSPAYQWLVDGQPVATGASYTTSALNNGDIVSCVLTSNAACATSTTAQSNSITVSVATSVTPTVTIAASQNNVCSGTAINFTSSAINGGASPTYQWLRNGVNINGAASSIYSSSLLATGDVISLQVTSNAPCASPVTANSNAVTMAITPTVTPTVSISASANPVCAGTGVVLTAQSSNGGSAPVYIWSVNGGFVSSGLSASTTLSPNNGDAITCRMMSNANCAAPDTVASNSVAITVSAVVVPAISISGSTDTICPGTNVSFTSSEVNGGISPVYHWLINGVNAGGTANFSSSSLNNGDVVSCKLVSSATCATPDSIVSNAIVITVASGVTPLISISSDSGNTICAGTPVTFTASATNGGNAPAYQWLKNGLHSGTGNTYSSASLNNGDIISCVLTTSAVCVSSPTATSNSDTMVVKAVPSTPVADVNTPVCDNNILQFTTTAVQGAAYQWTGPAGFTSTQQNPSIGNPVAGDNGAYNLVVTVGGCRSTAGVVNVTVNASPAVPSISQSGNVLTSNAVSGNQWLEDNNAITGATAQSYTATSNGWYAVQVTNGSGCSSKSDSMYVTITGISELSITNAVNILPNPFISQFEVKINSAFGGLEDYRLNVTDALGRVIIDNRNVQYTNTIEMNNQASGVYFLNVFGKDAKATFKLVKQQ